MVQETLHFDPDTGELHSLRSKEEAHDYRYFPEPDLVPLAPDRAWVEELRAGLPELPAARRRPLGGELGLTYEDAEVLSETTELGDYFERVAELAEPKAAANWIRGELRAQLREAGQEPWESRVTPELLAELIGLREDGTLSEPARQGGAGRGRAHRRLAGRRGRGARAGADLGRRRADGAGGAAAGRQPRPGRSSCAGARTSWSATSSARP